MHILLYPISILYGLIVSIRNTFYDLGIFSSTEFNLPIIVVGNLKVGGTGKTPMTEYLLRELGSHHNVAMISRGYGRKTKGFIKASTNSSAVEIGDEPAQIAQKFSHVSIAVAENRVEGVKELRLLKPETEVIILDDAMQHRAIKPGFLILLTAYGDLYVDDTMLPSGRLREQKENAKRANAVIVTKCPADLSLNVQEDMANRLSLNEHQSLYFAYEDYGDPVSISETGIVRSSNDIILLTGIANAERYLKWLKKSYRVIEHFNFSDHHWYSKKDLDSVLRLYNKTGATIVTTEKDGQRLNPWLRETKFSNLPVVAFPVEMKFLGTGAEQFKLKMNEFIRSY